MEHLNCRPVSHLCLRNELCDLLAGVEGRHLDVSDPPIGPSRRLEDLIMLLQDLPETGEVQVLQQRGPRFYKGRRRRPTSHTVKNNDDS